MVASLKGLPGLVHPTRLSPIRNVQPASPFSSDEGTVGECDMNGIIYLVGLIVVVLALLSLLGLR